MTPSQSRSMDFAQVTTICHDYTINGIQNMIKAANKPFRFVYVSGVLTERDQSKVLPSLGEYRHLRVSSSFYHLFLALSFDCRQFTPLKSGPHRKLSPRYCKRKLTKRASHRD